MDVVETLQHELALLRRELGTYRQLLDAASDAIFIHDADTGQILDVNETMLELYGLTREEALRATPEQLSQGEPPYSTQDAQRWIELAKTQGPQVFAWLARRKSGEVFPVEVALSLAEVEGAARLLAIVRDISRRQLAEDALDYRLRFEKLISEISTRFVSVVVTDVDEAIEQALGEVARFAGANSGYLMHFHDDDQFLSMTHLWNDGVLSTSKATVRGLAVGTMPWWMARIFDDQVVAVPSVAELPAEAAVERAIIEGQGVKAVIDVPLAFLGRVVGFLGFNSTRDGRKWTSTEVDLLRFVGHVFESALERTRAERALRASEEQLLQAQKMEAIGRLAGGIAHDFNNLLTAIIGYAELALAAVSRDSELFADIAEISKAGQRAEALTRQLLAFSRKQVGTPQTIDVNEVFDQLRKMIGRIIGEDVELLFSPGKDLWPIHIDPAQVDQIMVNLATNARDAMPTGGRLVVVTENLVCDETFSSQHGTMRPGDYVVVSVSDNGHGIPPELQAQIFEPFFSTKEEGKGTGLGLSTVYGLVRQNRGHITVYSRSDMGTTFRLYFPRAVGEQVLPAPTPPPAAVSGRAKILLVEDEEFVRTLAARVLTAHGYTVVVARDGLEARTIAAREGAFDLLLTDVIMPKMRGPELYELLRQQQPSLRCLFMSGYAEDIIVHQGVPDADKRLLQKPFSIATLTQAVSEVLAS